MVWALEELLHIEDQQLLSGHVAALLGNFDEADSLFSSSAEPKRALEVIRERERERVGEREREGGRESMDWLIRSDPTLWSIHRQFLIIIGLFHGSICRKTPDNIKDKPIPIRSLID